MPPSPPDLPRATLGVLFIATLIVGSLWILRPFLGPGIWAAMLVVSTWPLLLRVQQRLWNRRWLAVTVMTLLLVLFLVLPLTLAVGALVEHIDQIGEILRTLTDWRPPPTPPAWMARLPFVGVQLTRAWDEAVSLGLAGCWPCSRPTPATSRAGCCWRWAAWGGCCCSSWPPRCWRR